MAEEFLAIADADRVQEYVFGPHELRLIRGGSALQTELNRDILPGLLNGQGQRLISANGGTVLAAFASQAEAEAFCAEARRQFRRMTCTAAISTAVAPYPAGEFEKAREEASRHLEARKQERAGARFNGGGPLWAACSACGLHPATGPSQSRRPDGTRVDPKGVYCETCRRREKASDRSKFLLGNIKPAKDLGWIGLACRPENYIAFLYLDLDRMGRWLPEHARNDEERFRQLSERVFGAVNEAAQRACLGITRRDAETSEIYAAHEIFLIGGDDAVLAVPADRCFDFLREFEKRYEAALHGEHPPPFSVGMTIAHSHFPIAEFRRISQELVRSAKAIKGVHSIDYEIVTNSMVERIADTRNDIAAQDGRFRTRKPYSLGEFFTLEETVKTLKRDAPASKIRSLYLIAQRERMQAELDYLTLLARLERESRGELLNAVGQSLFQADRHQQGRESTGAADIAELWEFVRDGSKVGH